MAVSFLNHFHGLQILWHFDRVTHELELIPYSELQNATATKKKITTTSSCRYKGVEFNETYAATIQRKGNLIEISYAKNAAATKLPYWECVAGTTRIQFKDATLTRLQDVEWEAADGSKTLGITNFIFNSNPVAKLTDKRERRTVSTWDRKEQARLRAGLSSIDQKCAVSNCSIPDLLHAAHIRPVDQKGTDGIHNALLLRVDLHILFDKGLLRIDHETGKVTFEGEVKSYAKAQRLNARISRECLARIGRALAWRNEHL